jgi:hypothetical protein
MDGELEIMWKKAFMAYLNIYNPAIHPKKPRKTMKLLRIVQA